uniref:Reverse transcriptase Ty1/copia-type domain-containing protein n=1 Tax=Peronospora matthiolae TaxID=2874970 RepID=A0AAV1U951_9STRA
MNMARCMIFASGLPLNIWGDAVEYAAYILNRAPTNSNAERMSPMKVLTDQTPSLGEIVVFGSPCTVYRDPKKKNFAPRGQKGIIIGIDEETKGYRVYLPKDKVVVVSQHVQNIETLNKTQNKQVQELYLQNPTSLEDNDSARDQVQEGGNTRYQDLEEATSRKDQTQNMEKRTPWTRKKKVVTRSASKNKRSSQGQRTESSAMDTDVVNVVTTSDPRNFGEAMRSSHKEGWMKAISEELQALENNGVWSIMKAPKDIRALHSKWVFKTKRDAEGGIERLKARLVACGNEQVFGVNYGVTFAAVIDMSSVKMIFALARKWKAPAKHGDVPNAYVKADKEDNLDIYIHVPQGMQIAEDLKKKIGVSQNNEIVLELKKALYGLKQAGRLWSKLLHQKLVDIGFKQSLTDMCVYFRWTHGHLLIVGVYVDDLLVTGSDQGSVNSFFDELNSLSVKDLGCARKFLGMHIQYNDENGYTFDQEVGIMDMLKEHGLEMGHSVRVPITQDWNDNEESVAVPLPVFGGDGVVTVKVFQSLVGSLLWISRCTRPDIAFAVHKASRRTHKPTMGDYKLAKKIARYLSGTKTLRLSMIGREDEPELLQVVGYSDADFAADKGDRKSVTGGLITIDGMPVIWMCKKQGGVSLSTMEAEFTAASIMARELLGIRELLQELDLRFEEPIPLRVDNQAALKQLDGERASAKAKHIDVRIKFVGDFATRGIIKPEYRETSSIPADILTKALAAPRLVEMRQVIGLK